MPRNKARDPKLTSVQTAAHDKDKLTAADSRRTRSSHGHGTVVVSVLAVIFCAFCAWSAWEYSSGQNPLSLLDDAAAESQTSSEASQREGATATSSGEISQQDVLNALRSLSFDGKDVSLDTTTSGTEVVVSGDGIWVEERSDGDEAALERAVQRCCALSDWAADKNAQVTHLCWIDEDTAGEVRIAIAYDVSNAPSSGDTATLLSAASAYRISGDAYAELGGAASFSQSKGADITLPDKSLVSVPTEATGGKDGTTAGIEDAGNGTGDAGGGNGSSADSGKGADDTTDGAGETTNGASSPSSNTSQISISITVDSTAVGGSSASRDLSVDQGSTPYDALLATGANVNARDTQYGIYVAAINGLAEKEHGNNSGWVYSVNGTEPNVAASEYSLSDGDVVVWTYIDT